MTTNPDAGRLFEIAADLLCKHRNSIDKTAPVLAAMLRKNRRLLIAMATAYLETVRFTGEDQNVDDAHAVIVQPAAAGEDHRSDDTHVTRVPPATTLSTGQAGNDVQNGDARAQAAGEDQRAVDTQPALVPPAANNIPKIKVREHKRRTHVQKLAAMKAMQASVEAIYETRVISGKKLGNISYTEIRAMVRDHATSAASWLRMGMEAATNVVLLEKIGDYAQVTDPKARVRDVIPATALRRMEEEAKIEAPRRVELGMHRYREILENHRPKEGQALQ